MHVVHKTDEENISDEQIESQIEVLNADYRGTNADRSKVPDPWTSLAADPNIAFALATKDPKGKATNGITRVETKRDSFGTGDSVKTKAGGGVPPWPTDRYLNFWICNLGDGLLGYAQFPGGPAKTDGVVILYTAFGTTGAAAGLRSTWPHGDPRGRPLAQPAPRLGRRQRLLGLGPGVGHAARAGAELRQAGLAAHLLQQRPERRHVHGLHGSVDDSAMVMFTPGQAARMNATLAGPREKIAGL